MFWSWRHRTNRNVWRACSLVALSLVLLCSAHNASPIMGLRLRNDLRTYWRSAVPTAILYKVRKDAVSSVHCCSSSRITSWHAGWNVGHFGVVANAMYQVSMCWSTVSLQSYLPSRLSSEGWGRWNSRGSRADCYARSSGFDRAGHSKQSARQRTKAVENSSSFLRSWTSHVVIRPCHLVALGRGDMLSIQKISCYVIKQKCSWLPISVVRDRSLLRHVADHCM